MSLLLVPASRDNLEKSIENSVDISFAEKYLSKKLIEEITRYSGLEGIRCWAMTKNKLYVFTRIKEGDEVLLTEKSTGEFNYYGVVVGKTQNEEFGKALWPVTGENPWEYIYFLANITKTQINKAWLVEKLGYASNYKVSGVEIAKDDGYKKIGTISEAFEIPVYDNVAESNTTNDYSSENVLSHGKRRVGQAKFSKDVKRNYDYKCAICQIAEPEFLIAAHISSWAEDAQNRLNPKNGICLCPVHDKAFEHGYIGLNKDLEVIINIKLKSKSLLYGQLIQIVGKKISLPKDNQPSEEFLRKHRIKHKLGEYTVTSPV